MDNMTAALVGGLFDESGISAYARPVLFGTAGDAVRDALPDAVEKCYFVHDEREPELAGAESLALDKNNRFASLKALPECGHVLVLAAPFGLAEEDALPEQLMQAMAVGRMSRPATASACLRPSSRALTRRVSLFRAIRTASRRSLPSIC